VHSTDTAHGECTKHCLSSIHGIAEFKQSLIAQAEFTIFTSTVGRLNTQIYKQNLSMPTLKALAHKKNKNETFAEPETGEGNSTCSLEPHESWNSDYQILCKTYSGKKGDQTDFSG